MAIQKLETALTPLSGAYIPGRSYQIVAWQTYERSGTRPALAEKNSTYYAKGFRTEGELLEFVKNPEAWIDVVKRGLVQEAIRLGRSCWEVASFSISFGIRDFGYTVDAFDAENIQAVLRKMHPELFSEAAPSP